MIDDYDFTKDVPPTETQLLRWKGGESNIVDDDANEGSIWQNRPAYQFQTEANREAKKLPIIEAGYKKDWGAKPSRPALLPKDWSKPNR